ncbi:MAG TPA: LPS assembly protein LptD [Xanthomonadales bacterium]|nr:LPS assembly protein LptD [Xanthomonadales bacterium]
MADRLQAALAACLTLGLPGAALAQGAPRPDAADWSQCRVNSVLEFFVPDLPTDASLRPTAPIDIEAASVDGIAKQHYLLQGDVVVTRADQRIAADTVRYDETTDRVEAEGTVRYQDSDLMFSAGKVVAELPKDRSTLDDVRYQLLQARGNGTAAQARRVDADHTELSQVTFTTCDPQDVDWRISAREMTLDHAEGVGTARGMRVQFKDVTLLALPWATFPIDDRRKSGWLYPQIGSSDNGGFDLAVPYYLNLAPNYDATLVPRIITDRGFMAGGEFRYLFERNRGEVGFTYLPNDDIADRDRHSYFIDHYTQISPQFNFVADINEVSDDRYFEDFGDSLASAATSYLSSSAYINGRGTWWTMAFGGDDLEVTDPRIPSASEPYRRLPRFTFEANRRIAGAFEAGLRSELVKFDKDDAITGNRYDIHPYVAFPFERAAWYVRPELGVRHTSYDLDRDQDDSPSRTTEIASLDAGLFFDRYFTWNDRALRQTLEPRLFYLYVPFEEQDDLPLFDTQELTFGFGQLFRTNRYSGADRQMDANQLTLALSSALVDDADGDELLRASIGQIRYFDDQDVQLPGVPPTDFSGSAYAAELDLSLDERWTLTVSQQYDPEDSETDLSAVRAQYRFGTRGVANLAYRYRRDLLEQLDGSVAFPLNDSTRLVGRWLYSLQDEDTLEAFAGVEYESCCWALRLLGRHYIRNIEGESNNAIYLELELKGLGAFGRKSEDFLRRSIFGYR